MANNEPLLSWLNDAYAMERSIVEVLERQVDDAKQHPDIQAKIREHLEATKRHADLDKSCIERLGGSTSAIKSGMAKLGGAMQGMGTKFADDKLVKDALQDYSTEHMEIASYRAIMIAAEEAGDQETLRVCQQILPDEEAMARWLDQNLPNVVRDVYRRMAPPADQTSASASANPSA